MLAGKYIGYDAASKTISYFRQESRFWLRLAMLRVKTQLQKALSPHGGYQNLFSCRKSEIVFDAASYPMYFPASILHPI